ncbi:MAG TPA: ribbon-helix-helix protein, CopG family [Anaerolineae bacterium]|nr:ribbon-helix-helix protein, CopG family [Anaerolineae bacterium]
MSTTRPMHRIIVTMPPDLLQQVEEMAARFSLNRSQFIRQALETFLEEQRRCELRELLKEGYLANAERDRRAAEQFAHADYETVAHPVSREE